jgi:large repetitive protein
MQSKLAVSNIFRKLTILSSLLFLVLAAANRVQAGTDMCSFYKKNPSDTVSVVDGNDPFVRANLPSSSFGIDMNCEFRNFPISPTWPNGLTPTLNFFTPDKTSIYLIAFDDVWFSGNMACANIDHKLWVVNSDEGAFSGACQDIMVPAETIAKQSPAATATIGQPFTYTLTLPSMNFRAGDPSSHDLGAITVWDDLAATGADLTLVSLSAHYKGTATAVPITQLPDSTNKYLHFTLPNIDAGKQVVVDVTAVLNDTPANVPGIQFVNTAKWSFARWIDLNEDGIQQPNEYFNPLPGESGISTPMTIVAPNLLVNKTSPATAINLGDTAAFTIDVQNGGGGDAWNPTITDDIPIGMCAADPTTTLSAKIVQADGVTPVRTLIPGTDYSAAYSGCRLGFTMTDASAISPQQHLLVTYQTQLDPGFTNDGATLTNVAGATQWFSANSSNAGRRGFARTLTDGTPTVIDFQDSQSVRAALHGYYFEKTVGNLTSLENPAVTAAPGDTLHYRLRVFNVDQTINTVAITDTLNPSLFDPATLRNVAITPPPGYTAGWTFNSSSGLLEIHGNPALDVKVGGQLVVDYDVTLKTGLANGSTVSNQATLTAAGGFTALSDDPYINGVASPDVAGDEDPTSVTIRIPGPPAKANTKPSATIGERFEYTITVPTAPTPVPLYDVRILDTLPANLRFVSARVVTGGAWVLANTGSGNSLVLQDTATTGIDIPAGGQAKIAVTVELVNSAPNQGSVAFSNTASYTYNRANGVVATQLAGGAATTPNMTVAEPLLTAAKTFRFASPAGKPATDPATVGDVLEYTLTIRNSGTSTAFDTGISDTLPANVATVAGSTTATINGAVVPGFIANPSTPSGTTVVWGRGNGDGSLDIPAGQSLVLTYQVRVTDASSVKSFTNSAWVDWTSLDGDYPIDIINTAPGRERTGAGCGTTGIILPNDYCTGPASVTVNTVDNTSILKTVTADSWPEDTSTSPHFVRVGDTVTYDLTLNLQEYTTRSVVVEDVLPAGMALQSFAVIGGPIFSYTPGVVPGAGATGTLRWEFGDVINTPDGIATDDTLVIRAVAKVVTDAPAAGVGYATSIPLDNLAKLSYTGGDPALQPSRLTSRAAVDVRQPQMGAITKIDRGTGRIGTGTAADPYQVNIAADVMKFQLKSCNNGLAPAYNVQMSDLLASQLDENAISTPVVTVGTTVLAAGTDYTYTPPAARGGGMVFALGTPVNPGRCATVDYNVGFHTDLAPNQTWSNQARLPQYASLAANGRLYVPAETAQVWMTNKVTVQPLSKTLASPVEATIGDTVTYRITVPGTPMNTELANVAVTDTLHGALEYVGATAILNGSPLAVTTTQSGQDLTLSLGTIPAGRQAVVTLTTRVANNPAANAGTIVTNTASYTYTGIPAGTSTSGSSAPLTLVEPSVTVAKTVSPASPPSAGDNLHYTVTLTAASGANFSSAFDAGLVDSLSPGLAYVAGTARVGGAAVEPTVAGDGTGTPQTLTWTGTIDLPEGTSLSITYDVRVLATVVAGQTLTNSVSAQWTSLDGVSAFERTGSGAPAYNDYVAGPATTRLTVSDNNSLTKTIITDTYADPPGSASDRIARIGDTATYRLTLKLGEGTNRSVKLQDLLPAGMTYDGLVGITPASGSGTFTYTVVSQPAGGATGTLTWDLGTVVNAPSGNNTPFDALIVEYRAKVLPDAGIVQAPSASLRNTATLSYLDAVGATVVDPPRLVSGDTLTVRQPVMTPIVKTGNGATNTATTPLNVNVATETVGFQLKSCNATGPAPAYGVRIIDVPASQLNESSITPPVVTVGGTTLTAGTGYTYTAPAARGGSLVFVLNAPVAPGQCATVDYTAGFHTDFAPNQTWNNNASLSEYWSLPAQSGQKYVPAGSASFYMTNKVAVTPLSKTLVSPVSPAEATIGQDAVYRITVPGATMSGALDNVTVSDTLHGALEYVSASATLNGAPLTLTTSQAGQTVAWGLGSIPAGQQAVITLTARVANNAVANSGTAIANTASYTYTDMPAGAQTGATSAPFTIVEPSIIPAVTVANLMQPGGPPKAGDILRYTVTLTATTGASFSGAFDAALVDTLSAGLAYQPGSATVTGAGNTITNPTVTGDGTGTPQTLTWNSATAHIDIAEGAKVAVTYDVKVLDTVVAGQVLTTGVTARWTGLAGANGFERTGVDGIGGINDYVATAAAPQLTVPIPIPTLQKTVDKPVGNPGDRLRYTIAISNPTGVRVSNFSLVDPVSPMFQQGTVGNVVLPSGAGYALDAGTLTVTGLTVGPNETVTVVFDALLRTDLKSGTIILNQAELRGLWATPIKSDDDLNSPPAANPTRTVIPADGVAYDAVSRRPLGGVTLTMRSASTGSDLPGSCFIDRSQQNQVTPADGTYKFDLNFSRPECPAGGDYVIAVSAVPAKYVAEPSLIIRPAATTTYSVPACSADAVPTTTQCEALSSATAPTGSLTTYYLQLTLDPTRNQIFNNHIPVDPYEEQKISITKTSSLIHVTRGQLVPYTITIRNTLRTTVPPLGIVDTVPAGFKYVEGSARFDDSPREPVANGRQLRWGAFDPGYNRQHTVRLLLVVGAGVSEGEYVNRAQVVKNDTGEPFSETATATVRVTPDANFDCTDIIGKVFDDANTNGYPDPGEKGLPGARVVTARGLIATTDEFGRFHITCGVVPDEDRGSNFILKLDDRTLPTGYRVTSENPRVQRATRGKMLRFNFGATIHHVVSVDIADGVFEPKTTKLRMQWQPRIGLVLKELRKAPSVLRLSYLAETESSSLVEDRLTALKKEITGKWDGAYSLTIETEVFWRRGAPP